MARGRAHRATGGRLPCDAMILDRGVGSYGGPLYNVYRIRPQQTNRYARLHNDYASWNRMQHNASFIGLAEGP